MDLQEENLIRANAIALAIELASRPGEERVAIIQRSLAALEKRPESQIKEDARRFLQAALGIIEVAQEADYHPDWPTSEKARAQTGCEVEGCRIMTRLPHPH